MFWSRRFHTLIPRNPVVEHDLYRQQKTISFRQGFFETVGIVALALGFSVMMLSLTVVYTQDQNHYGVFLGPIQLLAWAFHAVVVWRLLAAGSFRVTKNGHVVGSDEPRSTPLSNWQLFFGN